MDDVFIYSTQTRLVFGIEIRSVFGRMLRQSIVTIVPNRSIEMPEIRKKPDLRTFRNTSMYKEIKQLTGLSPNNRRPSERWSLHRGLFKRENGLLSGISGCFSPNQHRRISNLFTPNEKDHRLVSIESKIFVCKFNKDGSKLITGSQDAIVRVFDSSKGTYHRINRIKAKDVGWSILDIDFSPCGEYFAYSTWSDFFFIVRLNNSTECFQWLDLRSQRTRSGVFSIRFSPQGDTLIGGCNDSCIYMFDLETRTPQKIRTLLNNYVDVNAVSYVNDQSPDLIVSGCNHGIIKLWDRRCLGNNNSVPVGTFYGHMDGITYIDPRNDGNFILSNSKDQSIKIWDLRKTTPTGIGTDGVRLPMAEWDYRWDNVPRDYYNPPISLAGDVSVMTYRGHRVTKSLIRAKFSPAVQTGQRYIYTGCGTGRIIIYDVLTGQIKDAIEGHKDIVRDLSWHPIRSEIVSSSWDKHVNLNTFKRNYLIKNRISEVSKRKTPLRRSRRIANRKRELDDDDDEDDDV